MKKTIIVILSLFISVYTSAQEIDLVDVSAKGRNFKFGARLGVNASDLDFRESRVFEVSEDAKLGGSFGWPEE